MNKRLFAIALLGLIALVWLINAPTRAIPAFARKHEFSCSTCHDPFPRLKDYGEEFAGNAFKPGDQDMPPRYYRDVGDDRLSLMKDFPVAARGDLYVDMRTDTSKGDGFNDFKAPFGFKLLSGGRVADDIGYYFYFYMSERGEVAGIEDAYLHFNDLFGTPLDVMVGQFQVSDPLFKRELRLTFQDYLIYKARPGLSLTNLTYDRGVMLTSGFDFGLDLAGIVVNGNGKGGADLRRDFDLDKYKHFMLYLTQSLGPVRIGAMGYYGKEELESDGGPLTNELNMWGVDATLSLGPAELSGQFLQRKDIHPGPSLAEKDIITRGIIVESIVNLMGDPGELYLTLLFNLVDSEALGTKQEAYTGNLTYMLRTNIKLLAEYTFAPIVDGLKLSEHRVTLGIVAGL
jgi:hypothetical protein